MKDKMKNLLLTTVYSLLTLFLLGCASLPIGKETKINLHREQKYCLECHTKQGYQELKKPTSNLCARCHQEIISAGLHPLEGLHNQKANMVEGLPLKEGKIVCTTCHEPHGKTEYQALLRKHPNDLCITCHSK